MEKKTNFIIIVLLSVAVTTMPSKFTLLSRSEWHANPPKLELEPLAITPAPFVIIHHSYIPPACHSRSECIAAMQKMQHMHQVTNGWNDIGYNFVVGGESDGVAYIGRGWNATGAHAPHYNNKSIGICLIGDWRVELPPDWQLATVHGLIEYGVVHGYIDEQYRLVGHRQVRDTECPGKRLFEELETWPHFDSSIKL